MGLQKNQRAIGYNQLKFCKRLPQTSQHLNISSSIEAQKGKIFPAACLKVMLRHSHISVLDLKAERVMLKPNNSLRLMMEVVVIKLRIQGTWMYMLTNF